jgi:hypothetical protein
MFLPRRFAVVSLLLCSMEIAIFLLLIFTVHLLSIYGSGIRGIAAITYLVCVPGSLVCAVIGLIFDRRRATALIALGVASVCGYFCTLQVLV